MLFRHKAPPPLGEANFPLAQLPLEIFLLVASKVNLADLIALSLVSRDLCSMLNNQDIWHARSKLDYPTLEKNLAGAPHVDWRRSVLTAFRAEVKEIADRLEAVEKAPVLVRAITGSHSNEADRLIELGFGIRRVDRNHHSPVFHAAQRFFGTTTIEALVKAGVDWRDALQDALERDQVKVVVELVQLFQSEIVLDRNVLDALNERGIRFGDDWTSRANKLLPAVVIAQAKEDVGAIKLLLDGDCVGAVKHCARNGNISVITALLLGNFIYSNHVVRGAHDMSLLEVAATHGSLELAEILLQGSGVKINAVNNVGNTVYQIACFHGHWQIAHLIAIKIVDEFIRMKYEVFSIYYYMDAFTRKRKPTNDVLMNAIRYLKFTLEDADPTLPIPNLLAAKSSTAEYAVLAKHDTCRLLIALEEGGENMYGVESAIKRVCI